ncbi:MULTISPECIES: cupin domain-containing protein [Actinosynnema]|uniref:cupin domain-containing protein n=1 Tax=Actinosynnema TaxID=40566 RepID=UPI0020A2B9F6|nr:cupin domain-containing protein [Actinosynnema pretiosum]MCP2095733.1 Mannose-6-phosphate isomerase, cupin superfamily [Actinosynnema pretiosum]
MIPEDDQSRSLTIANPDAPGTTHVSLVGNTYAMLITGEQTNGQYCLIEMRVPDGGGPPPHRHDFEEMFTVLEGEIEFTFRGEKHVVPAGTTINIPANAPHNFRNTSGAPARMLCMCTPAGQDEYFLRIGDVIEGRDAPAPQLTPEEQADRRKRAADLAPQYRSVFL